MPLRPLLAAACAVAAAVSVLLGLPKTVNRLSQDRHDFEGLTLEQQRAQIHVRNGTYGYEVMKLYKRYLRPGDRFFVEVPHHPNYGVMGLELTVTAPALFHMLPNLAVDDPRKADVIFVFGRDPRRLTVPVGELYGQPPFVYAARVKKQ